ncbi:uncharacterized protein MONOS_3178 [Monocercomonoides exilis]|uniref:uncharacterized protein n=1 Tax=Monocercomonoides exilis TaxID=2049356 RepID=UPI00355A7049|nr:hypothetical protein MONOS_3178 [Monocercomonoides exilis]|eukprot:MONOS_3178.1-p1 / transcript=MONOS_3178.1 / gene=MONOS_3178 / organism=Monocercomonoides_exilis_PA203 / gene_product=unspecified product / transcript_product=unspecified product / location=Mono_scaffold00072:121794-133853(-) / protein_length=3924 / sequence_SO=supercontig / SO=protein_coding / is_pseudo=false
MNDVIKKNDFRKDVVVRDILEPLCDCERSRECLPENACLHRLREIDKDNRRRLYGLASISAPVSICNSSLSFYSLQLNSEGDDAVASLSDQSTFFVGNCLLSLSQVSGADFVHSWGGSMCFFNLSLALSGPNCLVHSLVSFPEASAQQAHRNSIKIMDSSFSSFGLFDSQPLVQSSCCDVIKIELCSFENISQEHARNNVSCAQCSSFTLASCIICSIANPTEGCIAPRISDGSLHFLNSSFLRCSKTAGQKINHTGSENTLVDNCFFVNCISPCKGEGPFTISNNNMTSCEAIWGGGCIHIHRGFTKNDIISDCSFKNCFVTGRDVHCNGGGAIWNGEGAKVSYSNVAFENCCANETVGGAIYFDSRDISLVHHSSLSFCLFVDCDALGDGKDIYAESPWQDILKESQFKWCLTSNFAEANRLVFGVGGDKSSWIGKNEIYVDTMGRDEPLCGWKTNPCLTVRNSVRDATSAKKDHPSRININAGSYVEQPLVIDSKYLVFEGSSNYGTKLSASSVNAKALVEVSSGYASMLGLFIVRNSSASTEQPLFSVSSASGELVLCLCKISAEPSQVSPFTTAFAAVSAGLLNVSSTTVESMIFSDVSAVRMESSTLHCFNFENASFRGITRSEGSGSVFDVTLASGDELDLDEVSFSRCVCSKGDGGSVSCVLEGGGRLMLGTTKRIEMEGCGVPQDSIRKGKGGGVHLKVVGSSSNFAICDAGFGGCTAWKGNNIFVDAISLSVSITRSTFGFVETGMSDDDLMGFEEEWRADPVPLLAYLQVFSGAAVVGGAKRRDFSGCGTANYPCGSIGYAAGLRFGSRKRIITLNGDFEWTESVVFDAFGWEVKSPTRGQETKVSSGGTSTAEGMVTVEIGSLIANLSLSAATELGRHSWFILCQCGELSMADCSLKCSSSGNAAFGFGFIKINGGSLLLSRFSTASQIGFGSGSLISLSGAGMLNCDGCTMNSIRKTSGNGGCISIEKNSLLGNSGCREITIDGCTFSDCCVGGNGGEGGEGGGVSAWLGENDILAVNGSSCFEECLAPSEEGSGGKGGGMCLRCGDESFSFEIRNEVEFSKVKGNKAEFGKDVFVGCESGVLLSQMINSSSLGFFDSMKQPTDALGLSGSENGSDSVVIPLHAYLCRLQSEIITDSGNGVDHTHCGYASFACLSIDHCVGSRISDTLHNIKVVSRSVIQQEISISSTSANIYSEALVPVSVRDTGGTTQEGLVMCLSPVFLSNLSLSVPRAFGAARKAFLLCSSSLSIANCCVECSSENAGDPVSFSVIFVKRGDLVVSGFTMEVGVAFTTSPIWIWGYNAVTMENSSVCGMRRMNGDGGCLYINEANGDGKSITIQKCNFSGMCDEGNGIRGGGIMGNVGSGNALSVKSTSFENCMVPSDGSENGGKGLGGGMYLCLKESIGSLAFDNISFRSCNAWKGKELFVDGEDLRQIVGDWLQCFKTETILAEDMMGFERSTTNREFHIPLMLYFRAFEEPCFIGGAEEKSLDYTGCGFSDYPCGTLPYGGFVRFGDSKAHLRLTDRFCFADAIILSSQEMDIDAGANGTEINVLSDGAGEGEGLIETSNAISFSGIAFNVSTTFTAAERKSLFLCCGSALSLVDCSVSAQSKKIGFGYVIVRGGSLHVLRGVLNEIELVGAPVVELSGSGSRCTMEDVEWNNLKTGSAEGLVVAKSSSHVEMKNSKVSGPTKFENHGVLFVEESSSAAVEKSNFSLLTRNEGNGVVIVVRVGGGKTLSVDCCSFTTISCMASGSQGGSVIASVSANGELLFNNNTVEESKVRKADGLGGGLHMEFLSSEVGYSMKNNIFRSNDAMLGYDVYLVCPAPRMTIDRNKWAGSATEGQEEETMWVIDPSFPDGTDTLLKYLFPRADEIIYVNTLNGQTDKCGADDYPCVELWYASRKMTEEKRILRVLSSCELSGAIEKENVSITIEGKGEDGSRVIVGKEGHLKMGVGTTLTTLTISKIGFELPGASDFAELVEVGVGKTYFVECTFGSADPEAPAETSMRIITGRGGRISLDGVTIKNMEYKADYGIFLSGEVGCTFDSVEVSNIRSSGKGMVVGEGGTEVLVNELRSTNCTFGNGGFVVLKKVKMLKWKNGTSMTDCRNEGGNGGCGFISVEGESDVEMNGTSIRSCSVNEEGGRGGGLYLEISENRLVRMKLTEMGFAENCAFEGKDMFVLSTDVNATVVRERFAFQLQNERNESVVDLKGTDDALLGGSVVDLLLFLIQRKENTILVSRGGMDILGCGSAEFGCLSFWRGYENIDLEAPNRVMQIDTGANIKNHFDLSSFKVVSRKADERCVVLFEDALEGGEEKSVIRNTKELKLELVQLSLPSSFTNNENVLLHSSSADSCLSLNGCTFKCSSASDLEFCLICSEGGDVQLESCDFSSLSFSSTPVLLNSSCEIIGCNFSSISAKWSQKGGAVCVELVGEATFSMSQTETVGCGCSEEQGKGGFAFVECQGALVENPFVFGEDVSFAGHKAQRGKNIFIWAGDLNKTVTLSTFCFDFRKSGEDELLFCGRDLVWEDTTLLRFLEAFTSATIFVSSGGYDIMRCGSAEDPCRSVWKGMRQMEGGAGQKWMKIADETTVQDMFVLSNFVFEHEETEEDSRGMLIFASRTADRSDAGIRSEGDVQLKRISVVVSEGFWNEQQYSLVGKSGLIGMSGCSFVAETRGDVAAKVGLLAMESGVVNVRKLVVENVMSEVGVFAMGKGCECVMQEVVGSGCTFSGEGFVKIASGGNRKEGKNGVGCSVAMNESTFQLISRSSNGPAIISSAGCVAELSIRGCAFDSCKAVGSEKGGGVFEELESEGALSMIKSSVIQCGCDNGRGKGGGIYIYASFEGALPFVFEKMTFKGNSAKVGNDVFVECVDIERQINETQFCFDLRETAYTRLNAIYGMDRTSHQSDTNLMDFITIHQADTIILSSAPSKNGRNERQCGTLKLPCLTMGYGLSHLTNDVESRLLVDEESFVEKEMDLEDVSVASRRDDASKVSIFRDIPQTRGSVITARGSVSVTNIEFFFGSDFSTAHRVLVAAEAGSLSLLSCSFAQSQEESSTQAIGLGLISAEGGEVEISKMNISRIWLCGESAIGIVDSEESEESEGRVVLSEMKVEDVVLDEGAFILIEGARSLSEQAKNGRERLVELKAVSFNNVSSAQEEGGVIGCSTFNEGIYFDNCSFGNTSSKSEGGSVMTFCRCSSVSIYWNVLRGELGYSERGGNKEEAEICGWATSAVSFVNSTATLKDTTIENFSKGGVRVTGGQLLIEKGEFVGNDPRIEGYPSTRRNIVCGGKGSVNVGSLKGGDGQEKNGSLWMLNEGCKLSGIVEERKASLFVPTLESVAVEEEGAELKVAFKGQLLLPCNLSFRVVTAIRSEALVVRYEFESEGFVSEDETWGKIPSNSIREVEEEAEVTVSILFGDKEAPSSTEAIILKNKSKIQAAGDDIIVEGGKERKSIWPIIVVVLAVLFLIVLVGFIVFVVRWRRAKIENNDLREIVNDNIRKDPKAFEMVTMEMSPEEQWRRAEREAEKKNEERIKKRVYEKSLGHSESSEHLLSECGSTEYILGRDSDKIPQWMLEKIDEKEIEDEETRKRTPSPSISSTSTTDSDSTFIRPESMCPTTSSMSNLVDAMACSSPHEKLIVDLRDSLFMLLHGRNKTKEMAIGTVEERMATGAQILFWVGNVALHSFGEMEVPLESLDRLSPHIVLFSEHMVICVVMHSGSSSSEDSDSSSVSSLSVVSSSSNVSVMSERFTDSPPPSSAFEDEEGEKEYLRWRAPELLEGRKKHATKKSVVFSMGMMLWECVALAIPFGEYDAETAGEKVRHGERPGVWREEWAAGEVVESMVRQKAGERATLVDVKRELFKHFPSGTVFVTMSDAIDCYGSGWCGSGDGRDESGSRSRSRSERGNENVKENKVG